MRNNCYPRYSISKYIASTCDLRDTPKQGVRSCWSLMLWLVVSVSQWSLVISVICKGKSYNLGGTCLGLDALGVVQQGVQLARLDVKQLVQNRRWQLAAVLTDALLHPLKVVVVLGAPLLELWEISLLLCL